MGNILVILGAYPDVGKGIFTSSLGYVLKEMGLKVFPMKFDGYLNFNSGTMNPYHANMDLLYSQEEVFVLKDGFETDADSGYYERFLGLELPSSHNLTNGKLFLEVMNKEIERKYPPGEILKFVHLRSHVINWILNQTKENDLILLEVGGTVGDRECDVLYDALRTIKSMKQHHLHLLLLSPYFQAADNENLAKSNRTKITRQAYDLATRLGLKPDIIVLRCYNQEQVLAQDIDYILSDSFLDKEDLFFDPNCNSVYDLPMVLFRQNIHYYITKLFNFEKSVIGKFLDGRLERYRCLQNSCDRVDSIHIGIFGKTVSFDTFVSLREAIEHASTFYCKDCSVVWFDDISEEGFSLENAIKENGIEGIIVGEGINREKEKINLITYARIHGIPVLCISYGFDLAAIEILKNVGNIDVAFEKEDTSNVSHYGIIITSMSLGDITCRIRAGTLLQSLYDCNEIEQRNRHQTRLPFEVLEKLQECGVITSSFSVNGICQSFEIPTHPFFLAVKFHPEFSSWPGKPSPCFIGLIGAILNQRNDKH